MNSLIKKIGLFLGAGPSDLANTHFHAAGVQVEHERGFDFAGMDERLWFASDQYEANTTRTRGNSLFNSRHRRAKNVVAPMTVSQKKSSFLWHNETAQFHDQLD